VSSPPPGAVRLQAALAAGPAIAVVPYLMAGYPAVEATVPCLLGAAAGGAAVLELGFPFSDPLADGPTVQHAGQVALAQGMGVARALDQLRAARAAGLTVPVVTMTYLNPIWQYGLERYCQDAAAAGADGLLIPDLPADEAGPAAAAATAAGLGFVAMVAPTSTPARIAAAAARATAFLYCVARTGVTGAGHGVPPEALALLERVRAASPLPRALGFGLGHRAQLAALRGRAEAAVVGSALLEVLADAPDPGAAAERFVRQLR